MDTLVHIEQTVRARVNLLNDPLASEQSQEHAWGEDGGRVGYSDTL
jgi:hypothetical protein